MCCRFFKLIFVLLELKFNLMAISGDQYLNAFRFIAENLSENFCDKQLVREEVFKSDD